MEIGGEWKITGIINHWEQMEERQQSKWYQDVRRAYEKDVLRRTSEGYSKDKETTSKKGRKKNVAYMDNIGSIKKEKECDLYRRQQRGIQNNSIRLAKLLNLWHFRTVLWHSKQQFLLATAVSALHCITVVLLVSLMELFTGKFHLFGHQLHDLKW